MNEQKTKEDDIDLTELLSAIRAGKYFMVICVIVSVALGVFYLRIANSSWTVSAVLTPVQNDNGSQTLGKLGGLASLAGVQLPTSNSSDFKKFELMLATEEVAEKLLDDRMLIRRLFAGEWNEEQKEYERPEQSVRSQFKNYIKESLTGRPNSRYIKPNAARLAQYLRASINISLNPKTNFLTLSMDSSAPELSSELFIKLIDAADESFKRKFTERGTDALTFYQIKISKARSQEHREVLAKLIAKEEQKLMLASQENLFVAEILTGPNISLEPNLPRFTAVLSLSFLLGIAFGIGIIIIRKYLIR